MDNTVVLCISSESAVRPIPFWRCRGPEQRDYAVHPAGGAAFKQSYGVDITEGRWRAGPPCRGGAR